jgi:hypothetical protein
MTRTIISLLWREAGYARPQGRGIDPIPGVSPATTARLAIASVRRRYVGIHGMRAIIRTITLS